MSWKHHRIWIIAVLAIAGALILWFILTPAGSDTSTSGSSMPTTTPSLAGSAIYTNGEYGFTLIYPETAKLEEYFSTEQRLTSDWRVNAISTGTPILALIGYGTVSERSYPRHYYAIVRVGASTDPKELAACEKPTPNRNETELPDAVINGATWKAFSFGDAAMMQYVKGVSYRVLHEGTCLAVEQIQSGSSYRDDPDSPEDIADSELTARYEALHSIVESIVLAR